MRDEANNLHAQLKPEGKVGNTKDTIALIYKLYLPINLRWHLTKFLQANWKSSNKATHILVSYSFKSEIVISDNSHCLTCTNVSGSMGRVGVQVDPEDT